MMQLPMASRRCITVVVVGALVDRFEVTSVVEDAEMDVVEVVFVVMEGAVDEVEVTSVVVVVVRKPASKTLLAHNLTLLSRRITLHT
jgi:hypothetical protein